MGYNKENYKRIKNEYESKYLQAQEKANARRAELEAKYPEIREINFALSKSGLMIFGAATKGKTGLAERIGKLKEDNLALRAARTEFLRHIGLPHDYLEVKYECEKCLDTGYVETKMCTCMKTALINAGYESSGIGHLLRTQSFENFSLDYYKSNPEIYQNMQRVLEIMKRFAVNFKPKSAENLILFGGTGLGKTHLSSAVAKTLIDKGFDVVYTSANDLFADYEHDRFRSGYNEQSSVNLHKYLDCDLLIVDDLGSEVSNQFTVSCLYNLINSRVNLQRSTIISTNLNQDGIRQKYWDRITSRLLGEYRPLLFTGSDIRMKKLQG